MLLATMILASVLVFPTAATGQAQSDEEAESTITVTEIPPMATIDALLPVAVSIDTKLAPEDLEVVFRFGTRVRSSATFDRIISDQASFSLLEVITADVTRDAVGALSARIEPVVERSGRSGRGRLILTRDGVYPLSITLRAAGGGETLATTGTFVVRVTSEIIEPYRFAWIWPLYSPPPSDPTAAVDPTLADAIAPNGRLDTLASIVDQTDAQLDFAPVAETAAALVNAAEEDTTDSELALGVLGSLRGAAAKHRPISSPFAPVAPPGWDDISALAPRQYDAANETLVQTLGAEPASDVQIAFGVPVPTAALEVMRSAGATTIVVDPNAVDNADELLDDQRPFRFEENKEVTGVVTDPSLRADFDSQEGPTAAAQRLVARLALRYFESPSRPRGAVLVPALDWSPSRALLSETLGRIGAAPFVTSSTIAELVTTTTSDQPDVKTASLSDPFAHPGPDESVRYGEVHDAYARFGAYKSIFPSGRAPRQTEIESLGLQSVDSTLISSGASTTYIAAIDNAMRNVLDSVRMPRDQTITLTGQSATLPISIQNDSGEPIVVVLELASDDVMFPEGATQELTVPPVAFSAEVPVRTPGTGSFDIEVRLSSVDGALTIDATQITVRATAVNGVAVALSVGSLAFLAIWWVVVAHRRRRKGKHAVEHVPARHGTADSAATPGASRQTRRSPSLDEPSP